MSVQPKNDTEIKVDSIDEKTASAGITLKKATTFQAGITVTGNIAVSGTVDGVDIAALDAEVDALGTAITLADVYPVGAIYLSYVSTSPASLGFPGTWTAIAAGRMLVGYNAADTDFNAAGKTGGAKTVDLEHDHPTAMGFDATSFFGLEESAASKIPAYGGDVGSDDRVAFSRAAVSASSASGSYRTARTADALSTTQDIMNPFFTVYMWRRSA